MRKGKIAAQACHASLGIFTKNMSIHMESLNSDGTIDYHGIILFGKQTKDWLENSFTKVCVGCDSEEELTRLHQLAGAAGLPTVIITDNGQTEFHGVPTKTCIAIGPAIAGDIDKITGHLKLL